MNELITINTTTFNGADGKSVNGRELHRALELRSDFSTWIKKELELFVENVDYIVFHKKMEANNATMIEYITTIDIAKLLIHKNSWDFKVIDNAIHLTKYSGKRKVESNTLYLIADGEYTKIGIATNGASKRLKHCQTGNPKKLWVDFEIQVDEARKLESELHKKYKEDRLEGEWFLLSKAQIKEIKIMATTQPYSKKGL